MEIKIYNGYGHSKNLVVYGHVLKRNPGISSSFSRKGWRHAVDLLSLFFVSTYSRVQVRLYFYDQVIETQSDEDGFFQFKWASSVHLDTGMHELQVAVIADDREVDRRKGLLYIPHSTQYAFVSDIDDTIMISHSGSLWKRLRELLSKNAYKRTFFMDHVHWYRLLSASGTDERHPNPFFYVSSSEWNLYDYLSTIFRHQGLPPGAFLLSHFKRWYDFFRTGSTGHEDKYRRISRLVRVFAKQRFVLIGDNSQRDPVIYGALAAHYPERIHAIYIRNVKGRKAAITRQLFDQLTSFGVHTCLFDDNQEAIEHAISIGLISRVEAGLTHF